MHFILCIPTVSHLRRLTSLSQSNTVCLGSFQAVRRTTSVRNHINNEMRICSLAASLAVIFLLNKAEAYVPGVSYTPSDTCRAHWYPGGRATTTNATGGRNIIDSFIVAAQAAYSQTSDICMYGSNCGESLPCSPWHRIYQPATYKRN